MHLDIRQSRTSANHEQDRAGRVVRNLADAFGQRRVERPPIDEPGEAVDQRLFAPARDLAVSALCALSWRCRIRNLGFGPSATAFSTRDPRRNRDWAEWPRQGGRLARSVENVIALRNLSRMPKGGSGARELRASGPAIWPITGHLSDFFLQAAWRKTDILN